IKTFTELRDRSGLSGWQLSRVQHGLLAKMSVETLVHLANALQLSLNDLLAAFTPELVPLPDPPKEQSEATEVQTLREECDHEVFFHHCVFLE
ncbi:MAG: helix-turn-helix domain-containing protein, partial [Microcystaceae cyanobacterium]